MGIQVRKRTKGKSSWWNGSYSSKGAGVSGSVKAGKNVTYNTGDLLNGKTPSRLTVNFGNGIRYVSYGKKKSKTSDTSTNPVSAILVLIVAGFVVLMLLMSLLGAIFG